VPDERESDDLFEDLDKFFAPIKDVDWEEPGEPPAAETPDEEHVTVRPEPEQVVTVPEKDDEDLADAGGAQTSFAEETPDEDEDEDATEDEGLEDEGDWYDTASLETVGAAIDDDVDDAPMAAAAIADDDWPEETAGRPSAEELEEAAAHFADSLPGEEGGSPRVVQIDEETADDLLDELGGAAEPYPAAEPYGAAEPYAEEEEEDVFAAMADEEPARTVVVGAEGLGGPSWQEPAAVEVGADLERRGPDRDVPAAFLTGILLAGVAVVTLLIGEGVFAVFAALVALVAQGELYGVMVAHHRQPATAVGLVAGALVLAGAYYHGEAGLMSMLALGVLATFLWFMTVLPAHRKDTLVNIGLTLLGVVWVPVLAGSLLMTLTTFGEQVVIAVVALTFVFDTAAFLIGSVWGGSFVQRPLAPATSPKKSVEGLIGATLIAVLVAMAFVTAFVDAAPGIFQDARVNAMLLGVVVAVAATFGDLAESLVKRDVGVKDMGSVLPGHGGVLDRIDSLLFVAPAALLFLRVIAF
jgi:phosphatidate cytidylyltransferase